MARIIVLVALGLGIYLLIRRYAGKSRQTKSDNQPASRDTVQCLQCKTYVPRDEAINIEGQFFCCKQHARDWKPSDK